MRFVKFYLIFATFLDILTLSGQKLTIKNDMSRILKVIEPFFTVDLGDTFVLTEDGKSYVSERNEEFHTAKDNGDMSSSYNSTFTISLKWAKQLIEDGYLQEELEPVKDKSFVNVFDEIDALINKYTAEMKDLPKTMANAPECLRVERATVLTNILTVLNHLKSLRK